jgi:O-acetyl-ADP-ribose deacetylase (regulator of RNase III)
MLRLEDYRALVALDAPFAPPSSSHSVSREQLSCDLVQQLLRDPAVPAWFKSGGAVGHHTESGDARILLRALLTVRAPEPLPAKFLERMNHLLQQERAMRVETLAATLPTVAWAREATGEAPHPPAVSLWKGDITTLAADVIVNAANAQMLGCFQPFHPCIDNAIHSAAGPQLREDCARIMSLQGHPEPTGHAKVTRGFNLPARFVMHTVGPIVHDTLRNEDMTLLARCYETCLDTAIALRGVRTVAFCAISTGLYGFPKVPAARIAVSAVSAWQKQHANRLSVVFNVFGDDDLRIYRQVLGDAAPLGM